MRGYPRFYCIFLLILVLVALGSSPKVFAQPAEWTLMFYMDADNNLEDPQMVDLEEMMKVGSSANINIVVLADRSTTGDKVRGYTDRAVGGIPNWTTAKLFYLERGRLRQLADWGELNMGDPASLKRFVEASTTQFPAKRYGLVFGDHGDGWNGIVGDESHNGDTLNAKELPAVFKEITAKTGKFELVGFDACLMANFETAQAIAPFGKAMVASEELEPGDGWSYTPIMQNLTANPTMDGFALGRVIVSAYREYYLGAAQGGRDKTVTLSVLDLAKIPAVEIAVNNLALSSISFLQANSRDVFLKTARARKQTEEFGAGEEGQEGSHFYDLAHYAENLKRQNPAMAQAADQLIGAVKSAVVYKVHGEAHARSHGLSIYFPPDKETLTAPKNFKYQDTLFSQSGRWIGFLNQYAGVEDTDTQAPELTQVQTTDASISETDVVTITSKVNADDIEEATFVLAQSFQEGEIIIGAIPTAPDEKGVLQEEWDGSWFSIGDSKKELICPITDFSEIDEGQETFLVEVPAQIRYDGEQNWRDVTLYFYLDFNEEEVVGEFVYAFDFSGRQPREVDVVAGDSIRPVYIAVDKNGEVDLIASDDENDILTFSEDDEITVGRMDVETGNYLIGFTVTDFSGNSSEEFTEVTIE
jgi:Clostripain family